MLEGKSFLDLKKIIQCTGFKNEIGNKIPQHINYDFS